MRKRNNSKLKAYLSKDRYQRLADSLKQIITNISLFLDKLFFSHKKPYLISVILTFFIILSIYSGDKSVNFLNTRYLSSLIIDDVKVDVLANKNSFEISGIPTSVKATVVGDLSSLQEISNSKMHVSANLISYGEGKHNIRLIASSINGVQVSLDPSNIIVTIKRKISQQFKFSYDLIGLNNLDSAMSVEDVSFVEESVVVKASEDTIKEIAYIKALVDLSKSSATEQEAPLVAYNSKGEIVKVDLVPSSVHASFKLVRSEKEVPIKVQTVGQLSDSSKAVDSISLSRQNIFLYGPKAVLDRYNFAVVDVPLASIVSSSKFTAPINRMDGIVGMSFDNVSFDITLADKETKTIEDLAISYVNNQNKYRFSLNSEDGTVPTVKVTAYGTKNNLANLSAENIKVYIDISEITQTGNQDIKLHVESDNPLVTLVLEEETINLDVREVVEDEDN